MTGVDAIDAAVEAAEAAMVAAGEAFSVGDFEGVLGNLSAAIRGFTAADRPCEAGVACARLGDAMMIAGNYTAGRAWLARAERLVADLAPCLEQGWVAIAPMGCDVDDPDELLEKAERALDLARRFGDLDLETKALADSGLARVQSGDVVAGMAQLDEAMALVCGPAGQSALSGKSVCSFYTACYFAADYERFDTWTVTLRKLGIIGSEPGTAVFLSSHCDSVQASLLLELGRWGEAEAVLLRSIDEFETAMSIPSWHPAITLADLRIRQGRLADAEVLLIGKDQMMQALLPAARLHLARGDHHLAVDATRRGLRAMGRDRLRAVELLAVAVESHLALGDLDAAAATVADLRSRTEGLDVAAIRARAELVGARLLAARGDVDAAVATLEAAIDALDRSLLPWLRASMVIELARMHEAAGATDRARRAAGEVDRVLGSLDVVLTPADTELLRRLTGDPTPPPGPGPVAVLAADGGWWTLSSAGTSVRIRDTKGLRYLAELVGSPGTERHSLDLVDRIEGVGDVDRRSLGDAGALVDGSARAAYRRRIEALRGEIDDALDRDAADAAAALQGELDELIGHLSAAFGLGGRDRVAGSATERARLNVTRALRAALKKVEEALPEAGAVLDRRVRTGIYCAYEPAPDDPIRWIVQS